MKKRVISLCLACVMLFAVCAVTVSAALGDLNSDGRISGVDYILLKRSVLRTYTLSDSQAANADLNADGRINGIDYVILKRVVLGTYKLHECAFVTVREPTCTEDGLESCSCGKSHALPAGHDYDMQNVQTVGNLKIYTCLRCGYQEVVPEGTLIG